MEIFDAKHLLSHHTSLAIMIILLSRSRVRLSVLQKIMLSSPSLIENHLKKLETAGYVKVVRAIANQIEVIATDEGYYSTMLYISKLRSALEKVTKISSRVQIPYENDVHWTQHIAYAVISVTGVGAFVVVGELVEDLLQHTIFKGIIFSGIIAALLATVIFGAIMNTARKYFAFKKGIRIVKTR